MNDSNPAATEASGAKTVTVKWRSLEEFEVPIYRTDWPFEAALAAEQQLDASLLVALLPATTHARFLQLNPTLNDARDLLNEIGDAIGLALGESPASSS